MALINSNLQMINRLLQNPSPAVGVRSVRRSPPSAEFDSPSGPVSRFIGEWGEGALRVPYGPCSAEQLYRAFQRWHKDCGERPPAPPRGVFTLEVRRSQAELEYRVVTLRIESTNTRRSLRCWLPPDMGPSDGASMGTWMAECIGVFETTFNSFPEAQHIRRATKTRVKGIVK